MTSYVVATTKPWNVAAFRRRSPQLPGQWHLVTERSELTADRLQRIAPRYVFFPHWSWRVPEEIHRTVECVCFHMTDVPYGRGGSPLQNLIARGHASTVVSALRMVEEMDAGPVYLKRPLSLEGSAQEIFERYADLVYEMIGELIATQPEPRAQEGEVVAFPRRRPEESRLPESGALANIHDHIRMLDAETYPRAFLEHGDWRLELSAARLEDDCVRALVTIRRRGDR